LTKPGERPQGPSVCGACGCPFLQALEWARLDFETWKVTVSCPNCFHVTDVVLVEDEVRALYQSLESGVREVERALEESIRESFEDECQVLIRALRSNSVYPMDF
jgi:hypothetical protein